MKRLIVMCIIVLCSVSEIFSQTIPFEKFDKDRVDMGSLYVYDYSKDKEDFKLSAKKYLYIKTLGDIEVMSVSLEDTLELPDIYKYKMNWYYMMLEKEDYEYTGDINDIKIGYLGARHLSIDYQNKILKSKTIGRTKKGLSDFNSTKKFESVPTYFYQYTDLMPLWFALRFYPFEKEKITVNSLNGSYNVDFDIKYEGKEEVDGPDAKVLCYKFNVLPQVSFFMKLIRSPKDIYIWLTSEDDSRYMVKYINKNEQYSVIPSMEYRLTQRKKITHDEWEELKEKHISLRLKNKDS
ncbi:MAG: DUF3108 domain-containing protein [Calditrichaceae bacterium]